MSDTKRIRLFLVRPDDTQRGWASQARRAAEQHGLELSEEWNEDPTEQTRSISACIWGNLAHALIILPASRSGPAVMLKQALARGISVVLINHTSGDFDEAVEWSIPRLRRAFPKLLVARVAPDETEMGRVQARQVQALLPKGGRVLYVRGDSFSPTALYRTKGFEEIIGADPRYTSFKVSGDWTAIGGKKAVTDWIKPRATAQDFRIDMVCSQSDVMLPGIRQALVSLSSELKQPGLAQALLTGCDGLDEVKRDIASGRVTATVEQPSRTPPAVQLCADFFRSGTLPYDPDVSLRPSSFPEIQDLAGRSP